MQMVDIRSQLARNYLFKYRAFGRGTDKYFGVFLPLSVVFTN